MPTVPLGLIEEGTSHMAENRSNSFQNLGNGTYRVTGVRVSPSTGRYLTGSGGNGSKGSASSASVRSKGSSAESRKK